MSLPTGSQNPPANPPQERIWEVKGGEVEMKFNKEGVNSLLEMVQKNTPKTGKVIEYAKSQGHLPEGGNGTPDVSQNVSTPLPQAAPEPFKEAVASPDPVNPDATTHSVSIDDLEEAPDTDLQVNFKKVRDNYKAEKKAREEAAKRAAELEAELNRYKAGELHPEVLTKQEEELNRLRTYEAAVNLKSLPEFHDKFVNPLNKNHEEQAKFLAEYEIPEEAFSQLRGKSLRAQNEFLSEHFDITTATKMRSLLDEEAQLVSGMRDAETNASATMERLLQEAAVARSEVKRREAAAIQENLTSSWRRSLSNLQNEKTFAELVYRADDSQHNEGVNKIVGRAADEARKLIEMLKEDGLTKLRPEVGSFISRMSLLAHSSALNAHTREEAVRQAQELEQNTQRMNSILRPNIGQGNGFGAVPPQAQQRERYTIETAAKAASELLAKAKR